MKVLCDATDPKKCYKRLGWKEVFKRLGYIFVEWDSTTKPAFDAFDETEPDIFFMDEDSKAIQKCLQERKKKNIRVVDQKLQLSAADIINFYPGKFSPSLRCDASYIDHDDVSQKFLYSICHPSADIKVKFFGSESYNLPQYTGHISLSHIPNLYVSSISSLNLNNIDIPERVFQIIACGGFCISLKLNQKVFTNKELLMVQSPKELVSTIKHFKSASNKRERDNYILSGRYKILESNTYFHRVSDIFNSIGLDHEAERTMRFYNANEPL